MRHAALAVLLLSVAAPALAQQPPQNQPSVPTLPITISAADYDKIVNILAELPAKVSFIPLAILTNAQMAAQKAAAAAKPKVTEPPKPSLPPPPMPPEAPRKKPRMH